MSAQAFLDALLANPSDNTPRLVYADGLEERGEWALADFKRLYSTEVLRIEFSYSTS
jgi:uncharacterized protein (TIGR02996 family)